MRLIRVIWSLSFSIAPSWIFSGLRWSSFGIPVGAWFRGPLANWTGDILLDPAGQVLASIEGTKEDVATRLLGAIDLRLVRS